MVNVDLARRSTGGAGYTAASGFTELYRNASPMPTYEGDNTVMLGQASRYLIKLVAKAAKKSNLPFPFSYLNDLQKTLSLKNQARTKEDFLNVDILDRALQVKACHLINQTLQAYNASKENQKVKDNEVFQKARVTMVQAHMKYIEFATFRKQIETKAPDATIKGHLNTLLIISALDNLISDTGVVYDTGYLAPGSYRAMIEAFEESVMKIRPQMIPLVETYPCPDHLKPSVIGNSYGDIYEWQLRNAMNSKLNKEEVPRYFDTLMKPILQAKL